MELRQMRYFVRVVEMGSMGRAALDLDVVTSALSQQISRLENELGTRLLRRTSTGVVPTDAGLAFWHQAQLALRHADDAISAAQHARLSGHVSVGLAPSTMGVLGLPFLNTMRERYPDVRLRMVESLSGDLSLLLERRKIDLAILFQRDAAHRFSAIPLLDERLFAIAASTFKGMPAGETAPLATFAALPLILPSSSHGLHGLVMGGFARNGHAPQLIAEIDGLAMLMDAVASGVGVTIQPGAALARRDRSIFRAIALDDENLFRPNILVSLSDDELSPAALAARVVIAEITQNLVKQRAWAGASLHKP